jgi:hypothetical protein
MYRELEVVPEPIRAGDVAPPVPCECDCAEPTPADGEEAPAGNKTAVITQVYYVMNG